MRKLITLVTLIAVSSAYIYAEPVEVIPPENKTLSSGNNRFVYGQISQNKIDQYMLDTHTGRLWVIVTSGNDERRRLEPVPYVDATVVEQNLPESIEKIEAWERIRVAQKKIDALKN